MSNFNPFPTPPDEFQDLESWLAAPSTEVMQVDAHVIAAEVARTDVDPSAQFAAPPASDFAPVYQTTYPPPGAQLHQDPLPPAWATQPDNFGLHVPPPGPQSRLPSFGAAEPTGAAPDQPAGGQSWRDSLHEAPSASQANFSPSPAAGRPIKAKRTKAKQKAPVDGPSTMVTLEKETTLPARKTPGRPKKYLNDEERATVRTLQNRHSQRRFRARKAVATQTEAAAIRAQRNVDSARSEQQRLAEARSEPQVRRTTTFSTNVPSALDELEARIGDLVRDYDAVSRENTRLEILLRRMTGPPPPSPPNSDSESGDAGAEMERRDSGPGPSQQK